MSNKNDIIYKNLAKKIAFFDIEPSYTLLYIDECLNAQKTYIVARKRRFSIKNKS
jgi:hypothetical protein